MIIMVDFKDDCSIMISAKVDVKVSRLDVDFLFRLYWQDLDDNPNICRAEILNEDIESRLGGRTKFEFSGCLYSVEPIDSNRSYLVAY